MAVNDEPPSSEIMKEIEAGRVRNPQAITSEGICLSEILSHYEPNVDLAMSIKKLQKRCVPALCVRFYPEGYWIPHFGYGFSGGFATILINLIF